jgi:tetratricopeptide (TPR) repeat protein
MIPPARTYAEQDCVDAFMAGEQAYREYRSLPALDARAFEMALGFYRTASARCSGWEYADDALISLANCYFYVGDFEAASRTYEQLAGRFPDSDYNEDGYCRTEARFLARCGGDVAMETYRRASLLELREQHEQALVEYLSAASTATCAELQRRSEERVAAQQRRATRVP